MRKFFFLLLSALWLVSSGYAQETNSSADTLICDVYAFAPLVMHINDGPLTGVDIDLVKRLADDLGRPVKFREVSEFRDVFQGIQSGEADLAVSGLTITDERERLYDFTHPYLYTGLQILTKAEAQSQLVTIIKVACSWQVFSAIMFLFVILVVFGHLIWLLEQGKEVIADKYRDGIMDAIWYAFCIISTVGEGGIYVKRAISRMISIVVWIICSTLVLGSIFGMITSALTVESFQYHINGLEDLRGKTVAVVQDTYATESIQRMDLGCSFEEGTLSQSCQLLSDDKVDAVIFDAAPLLYFANKQSQPGEFAVVGELFDKQDYGIVMAAGSPLRETINRLILKYKQDGALETILHRYGM